MNRWWKRPLWLLLAALIPVYLLEALARMSFVEPLWWMVRDFPLFLMNLLLFYGVCLLIQIFRRHSVQGVLYMLVCLFCMLLGLSNYYKITFRLEPVLLTDITQMEGAITVLGDKTFSINVWLFVLSGVVCILGIVLSILFLKKKDAKRGWIMAAAGLLLVLLIPSQCTFRNSNGEDRYDLVDHAQHSGCLYTAFAAENYRQKQQIKDYSQSGVEQAYASIEKTTQPIPEGTEKPNIILVLGESFVDQELLSEYVDFTDTLMPFYEQLMPRCLTGKLYVPKVGGGTSETEFEVLTGMRSRYSYNPYTMGLPPIHSVASILREKGYAANAIHWHVGVFYNRFRNHNMLGFESLCTIDTTDLDFTIKGTYISDKDHFDATLTQMERTEEKDFIFLITMQNHGGYNYSDFRERYGSDTPFTNQYSENTELNVANYCYLMRETDIALEEWIGKLEQFPEPVVVVYFSDHLAPFGMDVYKEMGIPLSGDKVHQVPYFIWSNQKDYASQQDLYSYQLSPYVLSLLGLNDDPFFSYVEKLRQSGENTDKTYDLLCYDAIFGQQYAYSYAGITPQAEQFHIGGEMELLGVAAEQFGDKIYYQPVLSRPEQKYTLLLNGKPAESSILNATKEDITLQCVLYRDDKVVNQSDILVFHGTEDLLERALPLSYHAQSVARSSYELTSDMWHRGYRVFASKTPLFTGGEETLLVMDGQLLDLVAPGSINGGLQYAKKEDGTVLISLPIDAMNSRSGNDAQDYFKSTQATLIVIDGLQEPQQDPAPEDAQPTATPEP